jgi:hypothetical protein
VTTPADLPPERLTAVLAAMDEFIEECYDTLRGDGDMTIAGVIGASEALRDRFAALTPDAPSTDPTPARVAANRGDRPWLDGASTAGS